MYRIKNILQKLTALVLLPVLCSQPALQVSAASNGYSYLLMPTQITKINNTYYIVDSNHNQIIYSDDLSRELRDWNVMTRTLKEPQALCSDGDIYMVTDTENDRILTFAKGYDSFRLLQTFENVGVRPHYVSYDPVDKLFYAWSSMTGEMYIYQRIGDSLSLQLLEIKAIPELAHCYVRSFTIAGDVILFPAVELSSIMMVDKSTFEVLQTYPVSPDIAGMVQISIVDGYFFLTVSTNLQYDLSASTVLRARTLEDFTTGSFENLYHLFGNNGTPYFISYFDGSYYMIHENASPNIYRFHATDGRIYDIRGLF